MNASIQNDFSLRGPLLKSLEKLYCNERGSTYLHSESVVSAAIVVLAVVIISYYNFLKSLSWLMLKNVGKIY